MSVYTVDAGPDSDSVRGGDSRVACAAAPNAFLAGQKALLLGSGRDLGTHSRGLAPPLTSQGGMSRRGFPSFLKVAGPRK